MKTIFLMLVAVVGWGQTVGLDRQPPVGFGLQGPITTSGELPRYLVEYTTSEKCYECSFRTAMVCLDGSDCNTPTKDVHHFEEFSTVGSGSVSTFSELATGGGLCP